MEVFKDHGKRMSELIDDQRRLPGRELLRFRTLHIFQIINHLNLPPGDQVEWIGNDPQWFLGVKAKGCVANAVSSIPFSFFVLLSIILAPKTSLSGASNLGEFNKSISAPKSKAFWS